jgi:hypothetical protein
MKRYDKTALLTLLAAGSLSAGLIVGFGHMSRIYTELDRLAEQTTTLIQIAEAAETTAAETTAAETTAAETTVEETTEAVEVIEVVEATEEETTEAVTLEEEIQAAEIAAEIPVSLYDAELIGRTIWGEAGGVKSEAERAAVAWCILNRVDAWGQTVEQVVTKPYQFQGYRPWGECPQEHIDLAIDVLTRWAAEKQGKTDAGRVLPAEYLYFMGDGRHNHFATEYQNTDYWDWSLADPYK